MGGDIRATSEQRVCPSWFHSTESRERGDYTLIWLRVSSDSLVRAPIVRQLGGTTEANVPFQVLSVSLLVVNNAEVELSQPATSFPSVHAYVVLCFSFPTNARSVGLS